MSHELQHSSVLTLCAYDVELWTRQIANRPNGFIRRYPELILIKMVDGRPKVPCINVIPKSFEHLPVGLAGYEIHDARSGGAYLL